LGSKRDAQRRSSDRVLTNLLWRRFRSGLQTVHLWAGIILSIPFVLLGISGSILMLQPEAQRWSLPHGTAIGEQQSVEAILAAARAALPDARATRVSLPQFDGEPATVRFDPAEASGGENYRGDLVFVDPVSLVILGKIERPRPWQIFNTMRTLHATLYVRTVSDRAFVGWMGIALIFMCFSGLILWWPRKGQWRSAFGVKEGARGFRLHRDLHSAVGFWSLLLLLIVSISGLYLAFPRTFRDAVEAVLPTGQYFSETMPEEAPVQTTASGLDEIIARADTAVRNAELRDVHLPNRPQGVMVLNYSPIGIGTDAPELTVSADPASGEITYVDDPRDYALGEQVILWQRWLHSGLGLGIIWRVLVFISGFLPLFFAVTGVWMWVLKRNRRREVSAEPVPALAE
jgi:uncharacterized iron-regulated membrane protein